MGKLTPSQNALVAAQQYLKHEFRKIFSDVGNEDIWEKLDVSIENLLEREGEQPFWSLVAAISEGWKLKSVFYFLSSSKYRWELQEIPLSELVLTGMSPILDKYTIRKFNRSPRAFANAWRQDKKMREEILKTGFSKHKERDSSPILVVKTESGLRVIDGMRRVLLALVDKKNKIVAWVGYEVNPNGKPLVSLGYCYFLSQIYERSKNQDKNLEESIIRIDRETVENFRNGKETLAKRIAGWSHNPRIKRIFGSST